MDIAIYWKEGSLNGCYEFTCLKGKYVLFLILLWAYYSEDYLVKYIIVKVFLITRL